jgi:long-chain fatty acid transport protein
MKKTIKLAVAAALALGTTSAFATNGSALIGMGAKARGMGGTSIGIAHGAESGLSNPALITSVENTEISFGGTIFMPKVSNENAIDTNGNGSAEISSSNDSAADLSVIPEISIASKITDNFYMGIGMWGTAGMGTDYRDVDSITAGGTQMQMVTNLQLMQFGVPLAYEVSGFSVAVTPLLQYGALDINYEYPGSANPSDPNAAGDTIGAGVAQDLKFGYNIGLAYQYDSLTLGLVYKSKIDMDYSNVLSSTVSPFTPTGSYDNDKLSTPAEIGVGVSYVYENNTIAIDYKQIKWSDAEGYKDFEWEDQNVISIGYEYTAKGWAARVGYNYADSPISEQETTFTASGDTSFNSAGLNGSTVNTMNLLGFPAITTSHYAIGGTYSISETTSFDGAFTYAPEVSETYKNFSGQPITTKHSQTAVTLAVNYNF